MAEGTLGGIPFRIDPSAIYWTYQPKVAVIETVYGKVIQVFGSTLSTVGVTGYFGTKGAFEDSNFDESWKGQLQFLEQVKSWEEQQVGEWTGSAGTVTSTGQGITNGNPIRFTFPPLGIDMMVYIISYLQPGETFSIRTSPEIFNAGWQLTLLVYQQNSVLSTVNDGNMAHHIQRISGTFGWYPNKFNGPVADGQYPKLANS